MGPHGYGVWTAWQKGIFLGQGPGLICDWAHLPGEFGSYSVVLGHSQSSLVCSTKCPRALAPYCHSCGLPCPMCIQWDCYMHVDMWWESHGRGSLD